MSLEQLAVDAINLNFANVRARLADWWTNSVKPVLESDEKIAEQLFAAAIKNAATQLGAAGMKIVVDVVSAAEQPGLTGAQKLQQATAAAETDLSAANIKDVAAQTLNAAIEGVVAQLNANKAAA